MSRYPWVVNLVGTPTRQQFETMLKPFGHEASRSVVETDSMILVRELLRDGEHLGCVSRLQINADIMSGVLAVMPFKMTDTERPLGLTVRSSWLPTRAQSDFLAELEAAAQSAPQGLA